MIIAGIGCRKGATASEVAAALAAALARTAIAPGKLGALATADRKRDEPGIVAAAQAIGLPLVLVRQADLETAGKLALTASARVAAIAGVPSVAEAAALAAGGADARLIVPRIAVGPVTCALAVTAVRRAGTVAADERAAGAGR